jgi:hypothetical protein
VSLHRPLPLALGLILQIEFLKLFTMAFREPLSFVGAEKSPILVVSHSLHKQVWDPESIE